MDLRQVSSSQHPWDNAFVVCRWGGGSHRLQTFLFAAAKINKFMSHPAVAAASREGATVMMAAQGRVSWTEDRAVAVDDKGGRRSMVAGAFNVGNDRRLRGVDKLAGAKRTTQTQ